jgi:putative protease
MNDYSVEYLDKYAPNMLTASYELNKSELMHLNNSKMELCVYGYIPVMISAGCVKKTYNKCDNKCESVKIKDRLGNIFINNNYCQFCYNVLYNSTPLYLYDLSLELERINPMAYRFNFVNESSLEVRNILNGENVKNYTRGHYKRGVE